MCKVEADILFKSDRNIPIELVKSLSNWQDILLNNLPFLITICIISLAAYVTYQSNKAARREEQENKISEFRHQWLQEVRTTSSELIQIIHDCQYYTKSNNASHEEAKNNTVDTSIDSLKRQEKALESSFDMIIKKRSEFYKYEAKLKLLFKADEKETEQLFEIINSIKETIGNPETKSLDDDKIKSIVKELQIILKTEWEATKNRTWLKNT